MKKSYTVKEVIKMHDKRANLSEQVLAYDRNHFIPFMALFLCGVAAMVGPVKVDASLYSLIAGGAMSLLGGTKVLSMMTAETRRDWLDDKIDEVYEIMGPEFEEQVQEARKTR